MPYPIIQPQPDPTSQAPIGFDEASIAQDAEVRALMRQHKLSYQEAASLWLSTSNAAGYQSLGDRPETAHLETDMHRRTLPFSPPSFSEASIDDDKLVRQCARDWDMSYEAAAIELIKQGAIAAP